MEDIVMKWQFKALMKHHQARYPTYKKSGLTLFESGGHEKIRIRTPTFKTEMNDSDFFRVNNKQFTFTIAVDRYCGHPFRNFLRKMNNLKGIYALSFWQDAQIYLSTYNANQQIKDDLKIHRTISIIQRYLPKESKIFTDEEKEELRYLLLQGKADEILKSAQDFVAQSLVPVYEIFRNQDKKRFAVTCLIARRHIEFHHHRLPKIRFNANDKTFSKKTNTVIHHMFSEYAAAVSKNFPTEAERRYMLALQMTFDVTTEPDVGLPILPLNFDDIRFNAANGYGSLALKRLYIVHRRDIIEEMERRRYIQEQRSIRFRIMSVHATKNNVKMTSETKMEIPFFLKPFRKGNVWQHRHKPR